MTASSPQPGPQHATSSLSLRIFRTGEEARETRWFINGHPARILSWTHDEVLSMDRPPAGAQRAGSTWHALRMDP